jgi:hypothetical protein
MPSGNPDGDNRINNNQRKQCFPVHTISYKNVEDTFFWWYSISRPTRFNPRRWRGYH